MSKIVCFILISVMVLGVASVARADRTVVSDELPNPISSDTFTDLFAGIMEWVLGIVGLAAVGMIVYGGVQYIVSGGAEARITSAMKTIKYAIIGLVIVLLSYAFLTAVKDILGITVLMKMFIA